MTSVSNLFEIIERLKYLEDRMDAISKSRPKTKKPKLYKNQGVRWSLKEDEKLLEEFKEHKENSEIANFHERYIGAIVARQKMIVKKLHNEQKTDEDMAQITNLTNDEVKDRYSVEAGKK